MHESIEQCKITEQPTACLQAGGMNCDFIGREPDSEPAKRGSGTARQVKNRLRKEQGGSPRSGGAALRDKQKSSAEGAGREPDSEPAKRGSGTARQVKNRLRKEQGGSPRSGGAALRDKGRPVLYAE